MFAFQRLGRGLAIFSLLAAISVGAMLMLSGPGYRMDWWGVETGFLILRYGLFGGLATVSCSVAALLISWFSRDRRGRLYALAASIIALLVIYVPYHWFMLSQTTPPIHDIATDPDNPLAFETLAGERAPDQNPLQYGGAEVAAWQRGNYPDIAPLEASRKAEATFALVMETVADSNWRIAAVDGDSYTVEAVDQSFWFGFKDDVIVSVTPTASGSRVDMRSQSRQLEADAGTNARRVRRFMEILEARLEE